MGILIRNFVMDGSKGVDILVTDDSTTVQDYLDAVNRYILEENFTRMRKTVTTCEGCNGCCSERIPLTYIDIINLMKAPLIQKINKRTGIKNILEHICQITIDGRSADIILDRTSRGRCFFLDKKQSLCQIYSYRPLVCQTFICCPQSDRATKLREKIVNLGEDELVRQWLLESKKLGEPLFFHEAFDPDLRLSDWQETPFNKRSYQEVLLKNIVDEDLWHNLADTGQ